MLALEVDCDELDMIMVDFEIVDFEEPNTNFNERDVQRKYIKKRIELHLNGPPLTCTTIFVL